MEFNDTHKEEVSRNSYFPFGVHKVKILGFNHQQPEGKSEFIEVGFTNEDGTLEDKGRVYFTEDSAKYSFNTLRTILLHNVAEDKKDAAKAAIDKVENTEKLVDLLSSKLVGKEMWITKYLNKKGRTYEKNGQTFKAIDVNIYGYQPALKPELMPQQKESAAQAAGAVFGSDEPFPSSPKGEGDEGWA